MLLGNASKDVELPVPRRRLAVLRRQAGRPRLKTGDRVLLAACGDVPLSRLCRTLASAMSANTALVRQRHGPPHPKLDMSGSTARRGRRPTPAAGTRHGLLGPASPAPVGARAHVPAVRPAMHPGTQRKPHNGLLWVLNRSTMAVRRCGGGLRHGRRLRRAFGGTVNEPCTGSRTPQVAHGGHEEWTEEIRSHLEFTWSLLGRTASAPGVQAAVEAVEKRLRDPHLYLAVIGDFSSGKSTFVNALLGEELLASLGPRPATGGRRRPRFQDPRSPRTGHRTTSAAPGCRPRGPTPSRGRAPRTGRFPPQPRPRSWHGRAIFGRRRGRARAARRGEHRDADPCR
ncbi:dynamin family protein [Wenjunlia tyrosinilytica]|uniref:dynamin family protein n=1 Tax=Wenjunlia tyrosinilytica TaxID=1544741 RepID=UPI00357176F2